MTVQMVCRRFIAGRLPCENGANDGQSQSRPRVREDAVSQPVQLSFPFFDTIMITTKQEAA